MKLLGKKEFTGVFEKYDLINYDFTKTEVGEMNFMKCLMACLKTDDCQYFKHGNTITNINYSNVGGCAIWTPTT